MFGVCRQGVTLVIGIILAKSYLSLSDIGTYEIWMYLGAIISFLWLNGSFQAFTTYFAGLGKEKKEKAVFNTYVAISIFSVLLLCGLWWGKNILTPWIAGQSSIPGLRLLILFLWLHLISFLTPHIFLVTKRSASFFYYSIFYGLGYLLAVSIPIIAGTDIIGILQGLIIFGMLEHLILWTVIFKSSRIEIDLQLIKRFVIIAMPLALYAAISSFAQIFDAWLVTFFYNKPDIFAVFKYGARELPGALALAGAFSTAMIPLIVKHKSSGLERIKSGSRRLIHLFFPISIVLMLTSSWLFKWIYSDDFSASAQVFNVYLLLVISRFIFPNSILIALQKGRILVWISLIELIINMVLSVLFIEKMGLVGVALATVFAYFLEKILLVIYLKQKENITLSDYTPISWWMVYSLGLIIAFFIGLFRM
jgi:O-antigen/teichoic acid export membrane protein